ncbi:MAG: hypothetical protein H7X95_13295 [Deltaproteobacteria bacterium]|nr:hypothetical protein [Deltaproteobacteria bacterium]
MVPVGSADDGNATSAGALPNGAFETEVLARLRRSGFRIDRDGEFQHEGEPVRHEGLRQALFRWLDSLPDGRTILRLDANRYAYVDVDDTPLVARAARIAGDHVFLALSDAREEVLDPTSLTLDDTGVMRCRVRSGSDNGSGSLEVRLATSAATVVADLIQERPAGPTIVWAGQSVLLKRR